MTRTQAWEEARRLVIQEGFSYPRVAEELGLPLSTVQSRGAREGWQAQKATTASYDATMRRIKRAAQERVLAALTGDVVDDGKVSQLILSLKALETAYPEHRYQPQETEADPNLRRTVALEVLGLLADWLAEHAPAALRALQPHIKPFAGMLERHYAA